MNRVNSGREGNDSYGPEAKLGLNRKDLKIVVKLEAAQNQQACHRPTLGQAHLGPVSVLTLQGLGKEHLLLPRLSAVWNG